MKVKSFVVGTINGWSDSFQALDRMVADEIGDSKIISLTDQVVEPSRERRAMPPKCDISVVRVVVYE